MRRKLFLIVSITILLLPRLLSQQFYCKNFTINDGLPDNCIQELFKDSRGFLWVGTSAGLARFDGQNFKIYSSQDGLVGDNVWSVVESNEGEIWVGCFDGGISKIAGDEIISYKTEDDLVSDNVRKLYFSNKYKLLLIGTEDGLSVYYDKKFISFQQNLKNVSQRLQVTDFLEEGDFIYVFTNGNGLYKYNPVDESLNRIPSGHPLNNYLTNSAFISKTKDTLINFNRKNLQVIRNNILSNFDNIGQINDYKEDLDSNLWIASWNNNYLNAGGIFKYKNQHLEKFNSFLNIQTDNITSLEFDPKENIIWIGSQDKGLYLYPQSNISYYKASDFNISELNITDLIFSNSDFLWIATKENIIRKNINGQYKVFNIELFHKIFKKFIDEHIKTKYYYLIDKNGSFDKYNRLISSGQYPYANPYKQFENGKFKILPSKSLYKPLKYDVLINKKLKEFNSIKIDSYDNIWVGSNVGIFKIDNQSEKIKFYDLEGNYFSNFIFGPKNKFYGISWIDLFVYPNIENDSGYSLYNYYDHKSPINVSKIKIYDNKLWFVSLDHGLFIYDQEKFHSTYTQNQINNQAFSDICFDKNGNIIIGGINGNIYITNFINDTIFVKYKINKQNGLIGSSIRWLNYSDNGYLFAGTNAGLNIIDLEKIYKTGIVSIDAYDCEKGFIDYSGNVSATDKDGNIWIGSCSNLINIKLNKLNRDKNKRINFFIKSLEINDHFFDLKQLKDIDPWTNVPKSIIKLPHYKNSISFYYDIIKFLDPEKITFSYKLEGLQKNWSKETKDRKAVFQNLKPGNYRLRIKLINKSESESEQELSISFMIKSPIWAKWWVIAPGILILISIVWLLVYTRTKKIKDRERLKTELSEKVNELEMKALRSQMNPHFIFNAINSIQNYMLDNDVDSALNYLSDFAKLIRLTLDNVSRKQVSLEEELNYLKYYLSLEQMRFDKKFETEIIFPDDYEMRKILIPPMIIQPYIENSIKHGFIYKNKGGKIKIEFNISNDNILKCIIEDNGIGRKKSKEINKNSISHKSKGTLITNERLSLLNQTQQKKGYKIKTIDLYDEYKLASGTRVEIYIPI